MYRITFALDQLTPALARKDFAIMLAALMEADNFYLREHPETPRLRDLLARGEVRFEESPTGTHPAGHEDWADILSTLRPRQDGTRGANDRTLAAWRAAELQTRFGVDAVPVFQEGVDATGRQTFHAVVRLPNGQIEDPSGGRGWRTVGMADHPDRQRVTYVLALFEGKHDLDLSHDTLRILLDALTVIDANYLREHPETVGIYESGVRYEEEPPGQEDWQDIPTVLRMKTGDCDDLATWRAAEFVSKFGLPARAAFQYQTRDDGSYLYHILTKLPDGRVEDPSRELGMQ